MYIGGVEGGRSRYQNQLVPKISVSELVAKNCDFGIRYCELNYIK